MSKIVLSLTVLALLGATLACGGGSTSPDATPPTRQPPDPFQPPTGLASCASGAVLERFPLPMASVLEITPLGAMNSGGHLFPAAHLGIQQARSITTPVSLIAPAALTVTQVRRTTYRAPAGTTEDYALTWFPCAEVRMHLGHVTSIAPALLADLGAWTAAECAAPYTVGNVSIEQCTKNASVRVASGASLGTQLGTLDWGAADSRTRLAFVNPARMGGDADPFGINRTVCAIDYLPSAVRDSLRPRFGAGGVVRTAEPVCGTVNQDRAGTARGRWFINDQVDERLHLALVNDFVDPRIGAFSVGTSIPSLPSALYHFVPRPDGRVNADFARIAADGTTYCHEPVPVATRPGVVILVALVSEGRLRIEGQPRASCGASEGWQFTSAAVEFSR